MHFTKAAAIFLVLSLLSCFVVADESVRCCYCVFGLFGKDDQRCAYNVLQACETKEVTDYSTRFPVDRPSHSCEKFLEAGTYNKADQTCVADAQAVKLDVCQPLNTIDSADASGLHVKAWRIEYWEGKQSCETPCY
ncbi:hypothetical protein F5H01DRAFT_408482 [Linnemannia elongata]|nr:hypothetical protein F5H01DRAFT_408482 [Linnemannia elongata]